MGSGGVVAGDKKDTTETTECIYPCAVAGQEPPPLCEQMAPAPIFTPATQNGEIPLLTKSNGTAYM